MSRDPRFSHICTRLTPTVLIPIVILLAACSESPSPTSPSATGMSATAQSYLTQVLDVMQANSINRKTIDWPVFRQTVEGTVPNAQTIQDL